jgi:hypothetical protein
MISHWSRKMDWSDVWIIPRVIDHEMNTDRNDEISNWNQAMNQRMHQYMAQTWFRSDQA